MRVVVYRSFVLEKLGDYTIRTGRARNSKPILHDNGQRCDLCDDQNWKLFAKVVSSLTTGYSGVLAKARETLATSNPASKSVEIVGSRAGACKVLFETSTKVNDA